MWESFKQMKRDCMKEISGEESLDEMNVDPFDCKKMDKVKADMICVSECVARKANLMNEQGVVDKAAVLASIKTKIAGNEWKMAAAESIVDKCLEEAKKIEKEEGKCSAAPMKITHCIWGQFIQSCPADLQSDSKKCKKIRERLAAGDDKPFLHKAFFHHLHGMKQMESDE
ncbi:hypothetical protein ACFFRR_010176 [Megaselia abdita]